MDAMGAEGCRDGAGRIVFTFGGSLVNALVRSAPVVMVLILGQDSLQMLLALPSWGPAADLAPASGGPGTDLGPGGRRRGPGREPGASAAGRSNPPLACCFAVRSLKGPRQVPARYPGCATRARAAPA